MIRPKVSFFANPYLQDSEGALIAHEDERPETHLEHDVLGEHGEVHDVLEDEVLGPVVVAVGEVGGDQTVLEGRVLAVAERVHVGETLARGATRQELDLALNKKNIIIITIIVSNFLERMYSSMFVCTD